MAVESNNTLQPTDAREEPELKTPNAIIKEYLLEHVPNFGELLELKQKGWVNPKGDTHFKKNRLQADTQSPSQQAWYNKMMMQIGFELHRKTSAFSLDVPPGQGAMVLDLCMAPGGFARGILHHKKHAVKKYCGITLPRSEGGYKMLLPDKYWKNDRVEVKFLDITMLAAEMGVSVSAIPADHPDTVASNFILDRPFLHEKFDLVICDSQVIRKGNHIRSEYRERREAWRLLSSQLVLALQRVQTGGKIVVLLHKVDSSNTVSLLHTLSKFSKLQLLKPVKHHSLRSSFYVVAGQVQPDTAAALQAVEEWKKEWYRATFAGEAEYELTVPWYSDGMEKIVEGVLEEFGAEFVELGVPVWGIQREALSKAKFIK